MLNYNLHYVRTFWSVIQSYSRENWEISLYSPHKYLHIFLSITRSVLVRKMTENYVSWEPQMKRFFTWWLLFITETSDATKRHTILSTFRYTRQYCKRQLKMGYYDILHMLGITWEIISVSVMQQLSQSW